MDDGVARFFTRFGGNLFICLVLHSIGFMLFIAKVRAEPWARTLETWASDLRGTILPVLLSTG